MSLSAFLSAYDPSDLPGGSIDPLGFERAYLWLAERWLPGMTNVATSPRYFGMMCGAIRLVNGQGEAPQLLARRRRDVIMRMERYWALANALAAQGGGYALSGLRGVTFAQNVAKILREKSQTRADARFPLLASQAPYGALGIYGSVAERCQLLYRSTWETTPGIGDALGDAFLDETKVPESVRDAAVNDQKNVSIKLLTEWGSRAWLWGRSGESESQVIAQMLEFEATRKRVSEVLRKNPCKKDESEQERLARISEKLVADRSHQDLWEIVVAILQFESAYRITMLGFERLLRGCRIVPGGALSPADLASDIPLEKARIELPKAVNRLETHLSRLKSEHALKDLARLDDTREFLRAAAQAAGESKRFVECLVKRHSDVQHGKFDRGRRKMPWLEWIGSRLAQTMTKVGGRPDEVTKADQIVPHFYRTEAADRWQEAAQRREHRL